MLQIRCSGPPSALRNENDEQRDPLPCDLRLDSVHHPLQFIRIRPHRSQPKPLCFPLHGCSHVRACISRISYHNIFVMFTTYGRIFLIAKHQRSRIIQEINSITYSGNSQMQNEFAKNESKKKHEFKAAKMIGIVIIVFLVLFIPLMVGRGLKAAGNNSDLTVYLMEIGVDLVFLNSGINWLIYGSKNQHFKVAFKRILRMKTKNDGTEGFSMYDNCWNIASSARKILDKAHEDSYNICMILMDAIDNRTQSHGSTICDFTIQSFKLTDNESHLNNSVPSTYTYAVRISSRLQSDCLTKRLQV